MAALITSDRRILVVRTSPPWHFFLAKGQNLKVLFGQANAGDSRSVLCVGGEAKPMSYDHKPVNQGENARIVAAGGFVEFGRVNGEDSCNHVHRVQELITIGST